MLPDLIADARVFALPMRVPFRGVTVREGVLLPGPAGWGEFCPFPEYDDVTSVPWLAAAVETATVGWPAPVRDRVAVNAIVPAVAPDRAAELASASGCRTVKVKVAERPGTLASDVARVTAVREALGPDAAIRVDANAAWDVETAVESLTALDAAAGGYGGEGLQYAEQPCPTLPELAAVRGRVRVPIAADESIRRAEDPMAVAVAGAADIAVIKGAPLGGVRRALAVAEAVGRAHAGRPAAGAPGAAGGPGAGAAGGPGAAGLRCVVSSAMESSVGLAAELALAAALPGLDLACGLGTSRLLAADLLTTPLIAVDGFLTAPTAPPVPDEALLAAARPSAERERWWRERLTRVAALLPPSPRA